MKSAAKRRNFFSAFIALALLFCASHVASANVLEISKPRAELKSNLGQNRVSESLFYSVKHDVNYDWFEGIASESSVAPKGLSRFAGSQVDDYLDDAIDAWAASGKSKTFVIGEGQRRIGTHVRTQLGGDALEFRKLWPDNMKFPLGKNGLLSAADEATLIDFNRHLIRRLHEKGFKFIDLGRDGRAIGSKFYEAELQVLRELGLLN